MRGETERERGAREERHREEDEGELYAEEKGGRKGWKLGLRENTY